MATNRPVSNRQRICALWLLLLALGAGLTAPAALARSKDEAPITPGKYSEWNGEIDEVEIVAAFKLADYRRISVETFDTAEAQLPEASDNTFAPVKQVLADAAAPFVAGLAQELRQGIAVERSAAQSQSAESAGGAAAAGPKTLLIRAKVLTMDPGSRAKRYWGGFGAGATRAKLSGELVDAESGAVLSRFVQERRSGFGVLGGDYVKMMNRNLRTIGADVAGFLNAH
jgi:hypothetical protein